MSADQPVMPAATQRDRSQRRRVVIPIALGIIPLLVLAAANLQRQVQEGEALVARDRVALATAAALTVSGFVDTSFATLQTLAATPTLSNPTRGSELAELLRKAWPADSPLEVIGLFRPDGWNVALVGLDQAPLTLNVLDREYVQRARSTGRQVVSPATVPRTTGVLTVDLVVPVDFTTGGRGVVSGSLALTKLGDQLRALPGGDAVQIVLVDAAGQVILHPDPAVVRSVTSLKGLAEVSAVLDGQTGSRHSSAPDGAETLVAYAPVPGYGWGVLVIQPTSTAFALVRRDALLAAGILALTLGFVAVVGWLLGGRLSLYYRQLLSAKTNAEAAQARAEVAQQRLGLLAEASNMLASSLDDEATLQGVARLMVPTLADRCVIDLVDEGRSVSYPDTDDAAASTERSEDFKSAIVIPLVSGGRILGAMRFLAAAPRRYDEADQELAGEVTRRAALAIENARLYRETQTAVHARDEFLSVAAHELKTPVTSLKGFAQLALRRLNADGWVDPEALRKALETVDRQSDKLTSLVGQLLDISRIEAGRLVLNRQPIDLVEMLNGLVASARTRTVRHTIVLDAPATAHAVVDAVRIEQVMTNLLDNAIKYSAGGEIRVELSVPRPESVQLGLRDHGVGIPLDKRHHVFDRFYQAHDGTHESSLTGMGLGLYISRQIVELHGGTIHAEFPPDGGSRFVVTLPVSS